MTLTPDPRDQFEDLIATLYAREDDALLLARSAPQEHDIPQISIQPQEGALLRWLLRSVNAQTAVEIGALAGYSGIWLARGLAPGGVLHTVEVSAKHAEIARASFERAGLGEVVRIHQGEALVMLDKLSAQGPFDAVFIDADKEGYPDYLAWAAANLRPGGLVAAHNAYRHGRVLAPQSETDHIVRRFLEMLANDDRFDGLVLPMGDGMAVGLRR